MSKIPYARQDINQSDIDAVIDVLHSEFLTQGPVVHNFEVAISNYCGAKHAIAVNSATSGLHIACLALEVGKGDCVWTSPITFVASANCALYCGATVDFVDIDPNTYNISIECLEEKLVKAKKIGRLPKVVIPVHLAGQPCDMQEIYKLSQQYGFKIIEDASHAIGAKYKDEFVGNCHYSDITIFSFHPVKIITTCEGGMAITNDSKLAKKIRLLSSHGISSKKDNAATTTFFHGDLANRPAQEIWNYQQIYLGFNYRLSDIHAAIGLSQLKRLNSFVSKRHYIAERYNNLLSSLPLLLPWQHKDSYSSYHLYIVRLKLNEINSTQPQIYNSLHSAGVLVNLHYIPVYRQPYYENMGFKKGYCPNAEKYYSEALSIPMYPALEDFEQDKVMEIISDLLSK